MAEAGSLIDRMESTENLMKERARDLFRFHEAGLHRITCVIDGNSSYDAILAGKIHKDYPEALGPNRPVTEKIAFALDENRKALQGNTVKTFLPIDDRPHCFGSTRNNIAEFEFFESLLSGVPLSERNFARFERRKIHIPDAVLQIIVDKIERDVAKFYRERSDINPNIVQQQISYTKSYLNFCAAYLKPSVVLPRLFVVSNDHMPVHVAISMVMKALNVPRVYMQHAEVSPAFPPLDFEFSVLRSLASLETYRSIGPIHGRTYIVPRSKREFNADELAKIRTEPVDVVLYPTARFCEEAMTACLEALSRNSSIGTIRIKPHPNSMPKLEDVYPDGNFIDSIPNEDHVALVGNSSIAVDLLYRGIPVYQIFDIDPVSPDYYGLVSENITRRVMPEQLSLQFWQPYQLDAAWLAAFTRRRPILDNTALLERSELRRQITAVLNGEPLEPLADTVVKLDPGKSVAHKIFIKQSAGRLVKAVINKSPELTERVLRFMIRNSILDDRVRIATKNANSNRHSFRDAARARYAGGHVQTQTLQEWIYLSICQTSDPIEWLKRNAVMSVHIDGDVIAALERIFRAREPVLQEIFKRSSELTVEDPTRIWLQLKKADWSLEVLSAEEVGELAARVYSAKAGHEVLGHLESLLLPLICRFGTAAELYKFFWSAKVLSLEKLSINRQIAIIRTIRSRSDDQFEAGKLQAFFERKASGFHKLKFMNMDLLDGRSHGGFDHSRSLAAFSQMAPAPLIEECRKYIVPFFDRHADRTTYMDARISETQRQDLFQQISHALVRQKPFSLVRLSDGEGYLFSSEGRFFKLADVLNRERHWWGAELPPELRQRIISEARASVSEADVVGVPAIFRFIRDHSDRSTSLLSSIQGRGLLEVLNGVDSLAHKRARFAEDKINVALFSSVDNIAPLLAVAKRTVIVCSIDPQRIPEPLRKAPDMKQVVIPTHHRTSTNDRYHTSDQPLPFVYPDLLKEMAGHCSPGTLVLVAGGIVGKAFIGEARRKGAVALDLGSVIDDWSADTKIGFR